MMMQNASWRRAAIGSDGGACGYDQVDRLERPINDDAVFWATVRHYAELEGVDAEHLATTLRLGGVPGEPVTAGLIYRAASGLAAHAALRAAA